MTPEEQNTLLRRYEPVLRFTSGEHFLPMDIEPFVDRSSLWIHYPGEEPEQLVPRGKLTVEELGTPRRTGHDGVLFLKSIDPLTIGEFAEYHIREARQEMATGQRHKRFRAHSGRLARVGYISRIMDMLFSISLLTRGRISGDTATAAIRAYHAESGAGLVHHRYYGRAVRIEGWIALQYWFFYAFNNWRSGFFGLNDHEGDWEMITIFLRDTEVPEPEWIAYASHDFNGDDLRRHWTDPDVDKIGTHPVVYVGAGSHASYFLPGEYIAEIEVPFLARTGRLAGRVKEFWERILRHERRRRWRTPSEIVTFRVPFVDYARGNGAVIGPGQVHEWENPVIMDPPPPWAEEFHGLWGLYAQDPFAGENAPAGPLYNRDGTMRPEWMDPVNWCGLNKVPLPGREAIILHNYHEHLREEHGALEHDVAQQTNQLQELSLAASAMDNVPHLSRDFTAIRTELDTTSRHIATLRKRQALLLARMDAVACSKHELNEGTSIPIRAHLRRPHRPIGLSETSVSRLAEIWAAISIGILMIGVVAIIFFARDYLRTGILTLVGGVVVIEAVFRQRWRQLVSALTSILGIYAAGILLIEFFSAIMIASVLIAGVYLMIQNLRELWD